MEITELNLIGDFEAGIKCLQQNPSLVPQLSLITKFPHFFSFWTFGALVFAIFATFSNLFNRLKFFIYPTKLLNFTKSYKTSCQNLSVDHDDFDFDFDFSDDEYSDYTPSSVVDSDDDVSENDHGNEVFRAEGGSYWGNDEGQNGNFTLRRRNGFSWSDFSARKSVVQLWDSFGLGLDFEDNDGYDSGSEIAIWDLDRGVKISSGGRYLVAPAQEIYAAWQPRQQRVWVEGSGGVKEE